MCLQHHAAVRLEASASTAVCGGVRNVSAGKTAWKCIHVAKYTSNFQAGNEARLHNVSPERLLVILQIFWTLVFIKALDMWL